MVASGIIFTVPFLMMGWDNWKGITLGVLLTGIYHWAEAYVTSQK